MFPVDCSGPNKNKQQCYEIYPIVLPMSFSATAGKAEYLGDIWILISDFIFQLFE